MIIYADDKCGYNWHKTLSHLKVLLFFFRTDRKAFFGGTGDEVGWKEFWSMTTVKIIIYTQYNDWCEDMMRILVLIDIDDGKPGLRFRSHGRRQAQHCTDCPQPPPLGERKNAN